MRLVRKVEAVYCNPPSARVELPPAAIDVQSHLSPDTSNPPVNQKTWIALISALSVVPAPAYAFPGEATTVQTPYVIDQKLEFEHTYTELTGGPADGEAAYKAEIEYGVTTYWLLGVELEAEREAGGDFEVQAVGFETLFELDEIGSTGIEFGLFAEYEDSLRGGPSEFQVKFIFADEIGKFRWIANLNVEHVTGDADETEFGYAGLAAYRVAPHLELGLETFGDLGTTDEFGDLGDQEAFVGPVLLASFGGVADGVIEIEAGYLFALAASGDETNGQARLMIEWEKRF